MGAHLLDEATPVGGALYQYTFAVGQLLEGGNVVTARSFDGLEESPDSPPLTIFLDTAGPVVVSHDPSTTVTTPVTHLDFTFAESVDPGSLDLTDIQVGGPSGPISVQALTDLGGNTYRAGLGSQTEVGRYSGLIGPEVSDLAGNAMDQDGDGVGGESTEDAYDARFRIISNSALHFDGVDDFVEVPNTGAVYDVGSSWTLEAWVRPQADAQSVNGGPIVWKVAEIGGLEDTFHLGWTEGNRYRAGVVDAVGTEHSVVSSVHPSGAYCHVAVTYDGAALRIFVNGELEGVAYTGPVSPATGPAPLRVGNNLNTGHPDAGSFSGTIDEVRIWSIARTEQDLQDSLYISLTGSEPGLIGYWQFDEENGSQEVLDKGPLGNHGTLGPTMVSDPEDPIRQPSTSPMEALTVVGHEPSGTVPQAFAHVDLTFSRPVEPGTLTADDVVIDGPGGPIAPIAVTDQGSNTWCISFQEQTSPGAYTIRVGPAIETIDGGPMDQDGDGIEGEPGEDTYLGSYSIGGRGAFAFDGDDRVTIPDSPSLNPEQITVEYWVNFGRLAYGPGYSGTDSQFPICKGGDRTPGAYYFYQGGDAGAYTLYFCIAPIFSTNTVAGGIAPLEADRWYHVAGTYDGLTMRLYLDGDLLGSNTVGGIPVGNSSPLYFSYNNVGGYPYFLTGKMDEVRIWDYARSAEEIESTMYRTLTGEEPSLLGYSHWTRGWGIRLLSIPHRTATAESWGQLRAQKATIRPGFYRGLLLWSPT